MNINKHQTPLHSFESGTEIILKEIVERNLDAYPKLPNDVVICSVKIRGELVSAKLWMRHLLDECEMIDQERFENYLLRHSDNKQINLPASFEIIGYNENTKLTIIKPIFH